MKIRSRSLTFLGISLFLVMTFLQMGVAQSITFKTFDGLSLKANYSPPTANNPVVIMLHGLSSVKEEWKPLEAKLHEKGWGTLSYDARDFRTGTGDPFQKMVYDVDYAIRFLRRNNKIQNPLFLAGASIGANIVLNYVVSDEVAGERYSISLGRVQGVKGIILLSPGLKYQSVSAELAIQKLSDNIRLPVLMVASLSDQYSHDSCLLLHMKSPSTQFWDDVKAGHGVQMFDEVLLNRLYQWMGQVRR